ncbi:GTPase HflX [Tindallia californiensis]|uniref:GTPase HflX n=1 Tax=Tindallia californiensis TaxID=159292 RepID=A0A1H3N9U7_9FIRM|nr:GTPase HflX [Tindallia californiensis]SDY85662.1 GTP-binding protein HflX [Tindallia californiensis]
MKLNTGNNDLQKEGIMFGVYRHSKEQYKIFDEMNELKSLAETCGYRITQKFIQKRTTPHPQYYFGKGKLEGMMAQIDNKTSRVIICNDSISAVQKQRIEELTGFPVLDRFHIILSIFSQRAFSLEGKLQLKLAELQYQMPRLQGKGIEMSRQRGGIGTRGPGEMKLEQDRRHIKQEMGRIKRKLLKIKEQNNIRRKQRKTSAMPLVAVVGYTNAGKSSLVNAFIDISISGQNQKKVLFADQVFSSLEINFRKITLPDKFEFLVLDTVGFIKKLPHELVESFNTTLHEISYADLILNVIDSSSANKEMHEETTLQILSDIKCNHIPVLTVMNKRDLLPTNPIYLTNKESVQWISTKNNQDVNRLIGQIKETLVQDSRVKTFQIPYHQIELLEYARKIGNVTEIEYSENSIVFRGVFDEKAKKLNKWLVEEI